MVRAVCTPAGYKLLPRRRTASSIHFIYPRSHRFTDHRPKLWSISDIGFATFSLQPLVFRRIDQIAVNILHRQHSLGPKCIPGRHWYSPSLRSHWRPAQIGVVHDNHRAVRPSSIVTRLMSGDLQIAFADFATAGEADFSHPRITANAFPRIAAPPPVRQVMASGGKPASSRISTSFSAASGVSLAGFRMTALPAPSPARLCGTANSAEN